MKARLLWCCAASLAASGGALAGDGPKPTPEHEKLGYFVGDWNLRAELKDSGMGPGGKLSAKDRCEWFEGKFAVVCTSTGTSPAGPTKSLGILSYSADEKAYTYYGLDNSGMAQTSIPRGTREGETWTFSDESRMGGRTVKSRYVVEEKSPTEYAFKWEVQDDDGQWTEVMTGTETKVGASKKKGK